MTVANNYAPIRQLGDSGTTQYSAAWSMINILYAVVTLESVTTGIRTLLTQGVGANQYQISITSSGFTVTLGQPATSGFYVNVSRNTGLDQTTPFRTSKGFQGEVEEASFDKLTAMVQDARYTAGLALTIPSGETTTTILPAALVRALQFLSFDASGNVITVAGTAATVSSAMGPVVSAATLALARAAMAVAGLADNNAFSGTNTFATQAQFDASTKAATDAFVQRALGNIQGSRSLAVSTALTAADAGKLSNIGAGSLTVTLPALATLSDGATFYLSDQSGNGPTTIACNGGDGSKLFDWTAGQGSLVASLTLPKGEAIQLTYNAANSVFETTARTSSGATFFSWTPQLKFGGAAVGMTYSVQAGQYIQIGRFVALQYRMVVSALGSSTGQATIQPLPFSQTGQFRGLNGVSYYAGTTGVSAGYCSRVDGGGAICYLAMPTATGVADSTQANYNNGFEITGVIFLQV